MAYNEDMLSALSVVASLAKVKSIEINHEYYIVAFEDTTATLLIDARRVTREEIEAAIAEAKRS